MAPRRKKRPRAAAAADPAAMAEAVASFLTAAGLDPAHPDLTDTPARVSAAWQESFLDGYRQDPAAILEDTFLEEVEGPVLMRDIGFHSMCPHHLLPYAGVAHVAYLPRGRAVGFSQLVRLVDCFAHRLSLQERIAHEVAAALIEHVGAAAAACALDAEHSCVALRGVSRRGARVWTEAGAGDPRLQARLLALVGASRR